MNMDVILKLKRTLSPKTLGPMGWREIGERLKLTPMGARYRVRKILADKKKPCCPQCLQPLQVEEPNKTKT
jgi:hypothetical protein